MFSTYRKNIEFRLFSLQSWSDLTCVHEHPEVSQNIILTSESFLFQVKFGRLFQGPNCLSKYRFIFTSSGDFQSFHWTMKILNQQIEL